MLVEQQINKLRDLTTRAIFTNEKLLDEEKKFLYASYIQRIQNI